MIWHDHANAILDLKDRKEQADYWRKLPVELQALVAELVKMQKGAAKNGCLFAWRAGHEKINPEKKIELFVGAKKR